MEQFSMTHMVVINGENSLGESVYESYTCKNFYLLNHEIRARISLGSMQYWFCTIHQVLGVSAGMSLKHGGVVGS